jgi:prepilin-type N-terminal cleavage/methylation domain-containing protein
MTPRATRHPDRFVRTADRRGFTLAELLVAMGIIAVIATVTVIAIRGIARDARLASAKNALVASLDTARAMAMKDNKVVMVVFRPRLRGNDQHVDIVFAKWTGEVAVDEDGYPVVDRFVPIADAPVRTMSTGIKVACPSYFGGVSDGGNLINDFIWTTQVHLPNAGASGLGERQGSLIAIMFDGSGRTVTRNSATDSNRAFIDFNDDGLQREYSSPTNFTDYDYGSSYPDDLYFDQRFEFDEPFVTVAPYLAVYDDDAARELKTRSWTSENNYWADLVGDGAYITQFADRIHFNRYSGVVMQ